MSKKYAVNTATQNNTHLNPSSYTDMYQRSIEDNEGFWAEQAKRIDWIKPFTEIKDVSFASDDVHIRWFEDGTLNACVNCVDRHLESRGDQTAIIWEGDNPNDSKSISYNELHKEVCKLANIFKTLSVAKGDRVVLYMPMIPEAAYAMLACNRIGAVHSIVFGGFSPEALSARISACDAKLIVTADQAPRGGKVTPLKANVDKALEICGDVTTLVVERTGADIPWDASHDVWLHEAAKQVDAICPCEEMSAEDPLFILYTSGSTGKPKGVSAYYRWVYGLCLNDSSIYF